MVHVVPSRINYTARQVAELIFDEVYKYHGLPRAIVSDRDLPSTQHDQRPRATRPSSSTLEGCQDR
ncbi:hypothetical protein J132_05691 [Termitomyces sp. J132]|nr:hypothetical protein J132_05691 [Termitomyces sp. J132]